MKKKFIKPRSYVKRIAGLIVIMMTLSVLSLKTVHALNPYGDYDFYFDFSTGDPYMYSSKADKWKNDDAQVGSMDCSDADFVATVIPIIDPYWNNCVNVTVYPGECVNVPVPWFNEKSDKAYMRGESNHDYNYHVSGFWTAEPDFYYPED